MKKSKDNPVLWQVRCLECDFKTDRPRALEIARSFRSFHEKATDHHIVIERAPTVDQPPLTFELC